MQNALKVGISCAVVALFASYSGQASAGLRTYPNVTINATTHTASGAMGTARRVAGNQYISCDVTSSNDTVHCIAISGTAKGECTLGGQYADSRAAMTVATINPDSFIMFTWFNFQGVNNICGQIQVINSSEYEPKGL